MKNSRISPAISKHIIGESANPNIQLHGKEITDLKNPKIRFITSRCSEKNVLDLGCVQHSPEAYLNKNWLHKAIVSVAQSTVGLDLYEKGVVKLNEEGYSVVHADAQNFDLFKKFDVVVAGDLIEHLGNFDGFFNSISKHLEVGGKLLIATPNPWHWKRSLRALLGMDIPINPEHTCWMCPETLRLIAKRHGFLIHTVVYGSDRMSDAIWPCSRQWKHQSFYAELVKQPNI